MKKKCLVDECPKDSYLRGWCNAHYLRNQRTGSPTGSQRKSVKGPIPQDKELDHSCFNRACVNPSHLRLASRKQNSENRRGALANNKSSGVRGVYPVGNKWMARVGHNKKNHYLGLYETIAEAEAVAIATRIELFTHNDVDRQAG